MRFLKTNTATRVTVGPFFDKTDGVTPETGITVTACKLTFMVDTADVPTLILDTNPTASGGSNDMVHVTGDDAGFYDLELAAANVNYLGRAMLAITDATTHCPVFHEFMILPAMVYDSLVLGTDVLDTNVTKVADQTQTAGDLGADLDSVLAFEAAIFALMGSDFTRTGTAQGGAASEITLDASASAVNDFYNYQIVAIVGGTGTGQARFVADYVGATKVVTTDRAWATNPDNTSLFAMKAFSQVAGTAPTAIENADALLKRDMSAVTGESARSPLNAFRFLRNKWAVAAGTLTVRKEDDTTSAWTAAVSSDAAADPIIGSDPA